MVSEDDVRVVQTGCPGPISNLCWLQNEEIGRAVKPYLSPFIEIWRDVSIKLPPQQRRQGIEFGRIAFTNCRFVPRVAVGHDKADQPIRRPQRLRSR